MQEEEVGWQLPSSLGEEWAGDSFKTQGGAEFPNSFGTVGGKSNLSGQRATNAESKLLENVELGVTTS